MNAFPLVDGHRLQVCLWSMRERKKDPAETDEEKQKINEMQRALGPLDDDTRFIRIQIACLERCYWTFPANVDLIIDGIGSGKVNLDAGVSCQPPWTGLRMGLLQTLRHRRDHPAAKWHQVARLHHQQGTDPKDDLRQRLLQAYMTILTWWAAEGDLELLKHQLSQHSELAETIYRRLGEPTRLKWLYVKKLHAYLSFWSIPGLRRPGRPERAFQCAKVYDDGIREELGDGEDCVGRMMDRNNDNGTCHHAFFRHIDRQIASIGAGQVVPLPGAGQERKRIHEAVTNYVHVLGSWLARRTPQEAISIWPASQDVVQRVYRILRHTTPRKRWLVACLWEKLQENQARHGRGALDEQPERFALPPDALAV